MNRLNEPDVGHLRNSPKHDETKKQIGLLEGERG
jgi:hypothetical protein